MEQPHITLEPFSQAEKQQLEDESRIAKYVLIGFGTAFLILLGFNIAYYEEVMIYFFTVFLGIGTGFLAYKVRQGSLDLQGGMKRVSVGIITNKKHEQHTSTSGTGSSRRTETKHYYYVEIGSEKWEVGFERFQHLSTGQKICVKEAPHSRTLFDLVVLEEAKPKRPDLQPGIPENMPEALYFASAPLPHRRPSTAPFTEQDIAALKYLRNGRITLRIFWNIPLLLIGYFVLSILVGVVLAIVLKMPPMVNQGVLYGVMGVWVAHYIKKIWQIYQEHDRLIQANAKNVYPARVLDKVEHSSGSGKGSKYLVLPGNQQVVAEALYFKVEVGQTVYVHEVPNVKVLGVELESGEYWTC